jgi:uncharacterized protein involved in exopolysaccharide biosynthesis
MEIQPTLGQYARAVRRRWWLPLLLAVLAVTGVYYRIGHVPPLYETSAVLLMTAPPSAVGAGEAATFRPAGETVRSDIRELLRTRVIAGAVARRLGLTDPGQVQRGITVTTPRDSALIRIHARHRTPEGAQRLANATADELIQFFRRANSLDARESRRFIEAQLAQVRRQLEASERRLLAAQRLSTIEGGPGAIVSSYYAAVTALEDARRALREAEARLAFSRARLAQEEPTMVSETARLDNPVFTQIQGRLTTLELEQLELSEVYTPEHPRMQRLTAQVAQLRARLARESQTLIGRETRATNPIHARLINDIVTYEVERAAAQARIAALEQTLPRRRAAVAALPPAQMRLAALTREHEVLQTNYGLLAQRLQEAILRENVTGFFPAALQVVERAALPAEPRPSSLPRTAAAGALAGLVLGLLAAITLESADDKIRTREDAERALGVPVLSEVPDVQPRLAPAVPVIALGVILVLLAGLLVGARASWSPASTVVQVVSQRVGVAFGAGARLNPASPDGSVRVLRPATGQP